MIVEQKSFDISPALAIFSLWIVLFVLIFACGYALNLLGLPADPVPIFIFVCVGFILGARWIVTQRWRVANDPLELAGFLLVFIAAWIYFLAPSLPTLVPPSYSGDPAFHYMFTDSVYTTGRIVGDDPGGPSLIAATFAHWLHTPILRVLHPVAALWLALTAAAIYGIACALLPPRAASKVIALFAPFYLFVAWDYFAGLILGAQYFFSQAAGQLFVVAFVWYLVEFVKADHAFLDAPVIASFVAVWVTYQLWLPIPGVTFGWVWWHGWHAGGAARWRVTRAGLIIATILGLFVLATRLTGAEFIPFLEHFKVDGAVMDPNLDAFGGILIPVAGLGILVAWRERKTQTALALLAAAMALTLFLFALHIGFGAGKYWYNKSFFLWIFPFALLSVIAIERAYEWLARVIKLRVVTPAVGMIALSSVLTATIWFAHPPPVFAPLSESDIEVALWTKENLDTLHVNYIGPKSVSAQWLGVALWGEKYPRDSWVDLARLGPRTFEEWHNAPGWGEYLYIASDQHPPLTPDLRVVYQRGASMIVQKPTAPARAEPPLYSGSVLSLADFDLPRTTFRPSETISVAAQIKTQRLPPRRVVWRLQLRDLQNNAAAEVRIEPFDEQFPMQRWPDGVTLTQTFALPLPMDVRPGLYDLQLGLYFVGSGAPLAFQSAESAPDDVIPLGRIKIALPPVTTHELGALTRTNAQVGDAFRLLGYRLRKVTPLRPGDSFQVILNWQSIAPAPDYTVFVHLLDSSGILVAQRDAAPRAGTYATSIWDKNEIVSDVYELTIPRDAKPGDYRLIVGMYEWPSLKRLPVTNAVQHALGDYFELPIVLRVE